MLKIADIRNLSREELKEKAEAMKKELMQYRFQAKTGKLERQNVIKQTRREIARILTVVNESKPETKKA